MSLQAFTSGMNYGTSGWQTIVIGFQTARAIFLHECGVVEITQAGSV
jgi:hypothetical protein